MKTRHLGSHGPSVSAVALGAMGMSGMYGPADEQESIATIHAALDAGITLIDTGDFYGMGHNEMLVARALEHRKEEIFLSVKFGAMRSPDGAWIGFDGRPPAVKNFCAYSLQRLRRDHIDIYRPARLDPAVPIEDTIGAIAELVKAGYVRYIGLSELGPETIRRAHAVHAICDLQIEYGLAYRKPEQNIFPVLRELGIGVTAYGVLSRGLLSGSLPAAKGDFRAYLPRFTGANYHRNRRLVQELENIGKSKNASPAEIAIAWAANRGDDIVPLIGARKRTQLAEAVHALSLELSAADLEKLEDVFQAENVAGSRYNEEAMRALDSER